MTNRSRTLTRRSLRHRPRAAAPDASGDLLQIPETPDPLKTMYASEDEIRREMAADEPKEEPIFEVPPAVSEPEPPAPEPPSFVEPELNEPVYGDSAPPPSPFSTGDAPPSPYAAFEDAASRKPTIPVKARR